MTNTVYFTNTSRYWTDNNTSLNLYYNGNTLSANNTQFYLFSGVIPYAQQTNFTLISDRRTKTNIKPYEKSLSAILSLRPVTFQYNGEYGTKDDGIERVGLIAQDVEASQMPELVSPYEYEDKESGEKTEIYTVNPSDLIFTMTNAIAELEARVKALEAKLVS